MTSNSANMKPPAFNPHKYFSTLEGPNYLFYVQDGNYFTVGKQAISEEEMKAEMDRVAPEPVVKPMEGYRFKAEPTYNLQEPGTQDIQEKRDENEMIAILGEE